MSFTTFATGQTDVTTYWIAYNNTTGARRTDITHSSAGLTLAYTRYRAVDVSAVVAGSPAPVALAADNTAHTDWGVRHIGGGKMRIDFPDAAFAAGVPYVVLDVYGVADTVFVAASGAVDLTASDPRAAGETKEAIASAVRDDAINMFLEGTSFGPTTITLKDSTGADVNITVTRVARDAIASTT